MALSYLSINNLRNLKDVEIKLNKKCNVLHGANGSGKTSILEAAYLLSTGQSFRTNKIEKIINEQSEEAIVFGTIETAIGQKNRLGVKRTKKQLEIKIDGETQKRRIDLAIQQPVKVVTPSSHRLLESGPQWRRKFIDWGVFHVEHDFPVLWGYYAKALKQRNAALQTNCETLEAWTANLVTTGEKITALRANYLTHLLPLVEYFVSELLGSQYSVGLVLHRGYAADKTLEQVLKIQLKRDRLLGRTEYGPHRADFRLSLNGKEVSDLVSRGQQKLLVYALTLAQIKFLEKQTGRDSVLLLDDLNAELDAAHIDKLLSLIEREFSQVIITTTHPELLNFDRFSQSSLFHVEHGQVSQVA